MEFNCPLIKGEAVHNKSILELYQAYDKNDST